MGFWDKYGGKSAYVFSQKKRYEEAKRKKDKDLQRRLEQDAARVGYSLPSSSPASKPSPAPASGGYTKTSRSSSRSRSRSKSKSKSSGRSSSSGPSLGDIAGSVLSNVSPVTGIIGNVAGEVADAISSPAPAKSPDRSSGYSGSDRSTGYSSPSSSGGTSSTGGSSFLENLAKTAQEALTGAVTNPLTALVPGIGPVTGAIGSLVGGAVSESVQQVASSAVRNAGQQMQQPQQPIPPYQLQQTQPVPDIQSQVAPIMNELERITQDVSVDTAPIAMQSYNQVMDMIDQAEAGLMERYQKMGQGVDPATQAALASLKETVGRQRQNLMEEMSRRGLLQSGIWLEMEDRLIKGMLNEQQKLLAGRLSELQNQLNDALMNLSNARIQATQQYGTQAVQEKEAAAQRRQQAVEALTDAVMRAQEQALEQQRWQQEQAWQREKAMLPWTMGPTWEQEAKWTGTVPAYGQDDPSAAIRQAQEAYGQAKAAGNEEGMRKAHEYAEALRQAAGWGSGGPSGLLTEAYMTAAGEPTLEREEAMLPYTTPTMGQRLQQQRWETEWPYQKAKYEYDINKPYYKPYKPDSGGAQEKPGLTPYQQYQVREEAVNLAQNDSRWYNAGPLEQEAIVSEYMNRLMPRSKGVAPNAYSGGAAPNKMTEMITDEEIAEYLKR